MSVSSSYYRFSHCTCKEYRMHGFYGAYACGNKSCGHSIEIHRDVSNSNDSYSFLTPRPAQSPQCPIATNQSTSENTTLGPPAPNHRNFLPILAGETS